MTEEARRVAAGLRYCYRHIHCYSIKDGERCPDYDSCQKKVADNVSRNDALADLIETLSKQLDDQTAVIDRIYEQCRTLQNDLKELGFESIVEMHEQLVQTEDKLTELLSHATGGRFSKVGYSIDDMRRFVDDYNQSTCDKCDKLEQVEMERDGLNIMLAQAQAMLETRTKERDAAAEDMQIIRSCRQCKTWQEYFKDNGDVSPCEDCDMYSNWQWCGVEVEHGI